VESQKPLLYEASVVLVYSFMHKSLSVYLPRLALEGRGEVQRLIMMERTILRLQHQKHQSKIYSDDL
jgi:hypothetical protein